MWDMKRDRRMRDHGLSLFVMATFAHPGSRIAYTIARCDVCMKKVADAFASAIFS